MFLLVFVLVFLGLIGLSTLLVYSLGAAIKKQAQKPIKRFFAPVPRPGTFSFISNEGRVVGIFENVVGWGLEVVGTRRLFTLGNNEPGFLEKQLGVRWIGVYPTIKTFEDWKWSELQERAVQEDGKKITRYEIETRKQNVTDFFFQFSHPVQTEAIEIQGNYQVVVTMLITVLNLDPERAQFLNKDPAILLAGIIQSTVRSYICNKSFDEVKQMAGTAIAGQLASNQELWDAIRQLNGLEMDSSGNPIYETEDSLGVFGKLGKYIVRGEIYQVDAVGKAAEAIEAEKIAELQGNAKIKEAEKTGEAAIVTATKEAAALALRQEARANFVRATIVDPVLAGGEAVANVLEAELHTSQTSKINVLVQRGGGATPTIPLK